MNKKFLVLILVLSGFLLSLMFLGPKNQTQTIIIIDADQLIENQNQFFNKELRVRGFVKPGSVLRMGNKAQFIIVHNKKELPVYFNGKTQIPDTFADAVPVRVDGVLQKDGLLVASKIEAKCASKYQVPHSEQSYK